jgi:hypothetical protein
MFALQNLMLFAGCEVFPSGGKQFAHVLILGAAFLALLNHRVRFSPPTLALLPWGSWRSRGCRAIAQAPVALQAQRMQFQPGDQTPRRSGKLPEGCRHE